MSDELRWRMTVSAGQTRCRCGGAEGIRTPDLLIANETRYQLRHSPGCAARREEEVITRPGMVSN